MNFKRPPRWPERPDSQTWREDYLFAIAALGWRVHGGVVLLTYVVLGAGAHALWLHGWLVLMMVGTLALGALSRRYLAGQPQPVARARHFAWAHSAATALIGLCWGVGAMGVALDQPDYLGFFTIVLGGTALGAVSSQHALLRSCLLSVWTALPGLALAHLLGAVSEANVGIAAMVLLYGLMLSTLAQRMHGFLRGNVELRSALEDQMRALEAANARAHQAYTAKSRLLAQASHDLRQPVHAIGLLMESLRQDETAPERREIFHRIDRSLAGLDRLFRSLLDVTALDLGRIRAYATPLLLMPLLEDALAQFEESAHENDVLMRLAPTTLCVETDGVLLQTMVQNLLGNAVKYAPGGSVLIGCRRRGRQACIEIHDTGPGIAEADREAIFEEFFRTQPGGRSRVEGLGLGLAIVQRLAALTGIGVTLDSQPGRGTVFRLCGLPVLDRAAVIEKPASAPTHGPLDGLRVLVIDDDADVRAGMANLLERWNCRVSVLSIAPGQIAQIDPATDLLIIDQMLGGERVGVAVLEDWRAQGLTLAAAITTGAVQPELEARAAALGVPVLMKPLRPAALHSLLLTAATRRQGVAQPGDSDQAEVGRAGGGRGTAIHLEQA